MDEKTESYKILQQSDMQSLETEVNKQIQNGFEPYGDLQIIPCEEGVFFIQVVTQKAQIKHKTF